MFKTVLTLLTIKIPRPRLDATGLTIHGPRYLLCAETKSLYSDGNKNDCGTMSKYLKPR